MERQYFSIVILRDDFQNVVDLSFKRVYIVFIEYVINYSFVLNVFEVLEEFMKYGIIGGNISFIMGGVILEFWYFNFVNYFFLMGMSIELFILEEFFNFYMEMFIGFVDLFYVVVRVKLRNIIIIDSLGRVWYLGDFFVNGYVYLIVSVEGFEDLFIVRMLNGLYIRIIELCRILYFGEEYGYYNVNKFEDINEFVLNWCYVGFYDNVFVGVYYLIVFERFEGIVNMNLNGYYSYYFYFVEIF